MTIEVRSRIVLDKLHQLLAEVFALEKADKRLRGVLEPDREALAVSELAFMHEGAEFLQRGLPEFEMIRADEPSKLDAVDEE